MARTMSEVDDREARKIRLEIQKLIREQEERRSEQVERRREQEERRREQDNRRRLRDEEFNRRELEHQIRMSLLLKGCVGSCEFNSGKVTEKTDVAEIVGIIENPTNFNLIDEKAEKPRENSLVLSDEDKHSRAEERSVEKVCEEIADDELGAECMSDVATVDSTRSRVMQGSGDLSVKGLDSSCGVVEIMCRPMAKAESKIVCLEAGKVVGVSIRKEREPTETVQIKSIEEAITFPETCEESEEIGNSRAEENMFASDETDLNVADENIVCAQSSGSSLSGEVIVKGVKVEATIKINSVSKRRRNSGGFSHQMVKSEEGRSGKAGRHEDLYIKTSGRLREAELEICEKNFDAKMKGQSRYELSVVIILLRNWRFRKKIYVRSKLITAYV